MTLDIDALLKAERSVLVTRWTDLFDAVPPPRLSQSMMARILACELQWEASGQTRSAIVRKLDQVIAGGASNKPVAGTGQRLVRDWNGRRHVVDVTEEGYVWQGRRFRSLSAIAREITGTKWSGPRFFGVAA